MQPEIFFQIIIIVYSVVLHEIAHGYAAYMFGDKTAYYQNRLTLNPIPHIDLVGSIIVPAMLILSGSSILAGWAKPVPVAEHNLNPYKLGSFVVSAAGVLTNFILAVVFTILGHFLDGQNFKDMCAMIATLNIGLAVFNLIPVPPADGYRIASLFLPWEIKRKIEDFLQNSFFLAIVVGIFIATMIFNFIYPELYKIIVSLIY